MLSDLGHATHKRMAGTRHHKTWSKICAGLRRSCEEVGAARGTYHEQVSRCERLSKVTGQLVSPRLLRKRDTDFGLGASVHAASV